VICANQKIAQAEIFDESTRCLLVSQNNDSKSDAVEQTPDIDEVTLERFASEYQFNINKDLPQELRLQLLRILFRRKEAFARSVKDLKSYNKEQYEVHLKSMRPLIQKQFKHKPLSASKTEAQTKMAVNPSVKPAPNDNSLPPEWEMAKAIVRKRVKSGVTEFLVKFQDNSAYWCSDVSDELKRRFFLKLANERNRRRRAARQNFKD
jgi:hypothetical protein